ncbi:MAG: acyl-CoA dehydrogenase [Myxococcales bacterium]|nr:MAG: acyl-CoA dehydrogenase [Myxococcales bacterium]
MPIGITEDHLELASTVRKWAEGLSPRESIKEASDRSREWLATWSPRYAELGLATIAVDEKFGGGGGTLLDQAVALEAAAHALVPGPLLSNTVAALVDPDLAPTIAAGEATAAVAWGSAVLDGDGATHVIGATTADLRAAWSDDLSRGMALLDRPVEASPDVRRLLVTLAAAEAAGGARWCLETAVEYAGVREQFGQKIGSFQAIKHLCAEMLERTEAATAAAWDAAVAGSSGDVEQWDFAVEVAAAVCFDAAVEVAKACIQVLGGIGFTFEHDAHLYLRRALAMRSFVAPDSSALAALAAGGRRRVNRIDFEGRDEAHRSDARERVERVRAATDERAALADEGLLAPHWPTPYGLGADPVHQLVIDEELAAAGLSRPDLKIGGWAAPTILAHGNDAQRERFLDATLRGEITWCQLFSEPGAGSDLASLRTKAVRDDERGGWRISGQKVWTSLAQEADWAICLARTSADGKPHAGITYFVVEMSSPGIDIRPLRELTGEALFNEVFLDDVFVPDDGVVGEVNGGWKLAVTTLANERVAMSGTRLDDSVERAIELYDGASAAQRARIGDAVALATVVKLLGVRATLKALAGQGPGAESSIAKLLGVRSRQDSSELVVSLLGHRAFAVGDEFVDAARHQQLLTRCLSIAGGTTQVLRNVVGERILRLPR